MRFLMPFTKILSTLYFPLQYTYMSAWFLRLSVIGGEEARHLVPEDAIALRNNCYIPENNHVNNH